LAKAFSSNSDGSKWNLIKMDTQAVIRNHHRQKQLWKKVLDGGESGEPTGTLNGADVFNFVFENSRLLNQFWNNPIIRNESVDF
jgi:hypothetical protein